MDSVLGLQGKDYALVAADCSAGRSIMVMKHDADKIVKLDDHKIAGIAGVAEVRPGSILLMHVVYRSRQVARDVLLHILEGSRARGMAAIPVGTLFAQRGA